MRLHCINLLLFPILVLNQVLGNQHLIEYIYSHLIVPEVMLYLIIFEIIHHQQAAVSARQ